MEFYLNFLNIIKNLYKLKSDSKINLPLKPVFNGEVTAVKTLNPDE